MAPTVVAQAIGQFLGVSIEAWIGIVIAILAFWAVSGWALVRTLRMEDRKLELLEEQDRIEPYSPAALRELREWIRQNPGDPLADEARAAYNDTVATLKEEPRSFYGWSDREIEKLEPV